LRPVMILIVGWLGRGAGRWTLIPPLGASYWAADVREAGQSAGLFSGAARARGGWRRAWLMCRSAGYGRRFAWSGQARPARNQAFNVTNGGRRVSNVGKTVWGRDWPGAIDMRPGEVPFSVSGWCKRNNSKNGRFRAMGGPANAKARSGSPRSGGLCRDCSFQYADTGMRYLRPKPNWVRPSIVSTVKIKSRGRLHRDGIDTEKAMFRKMVFGQGGRADRAAAIKALGMRSFPPPNRESALGRGLTSPEHRGPTATIQSRNRKAPARLLAEPAAGQAPHRSRGKRVRVG